jgi:hypothetical protein
MTNRLQVGIDFSRNRADLCMMLADGQPVIAGLACANSPPGYNSAKQLLLEALQEYQCDGVDISGEATNYYWLPYFLQLSADPDLIGYDVQLFLLNPRWVSWYKKCFAQDDKTDQKDAFYIADRTRTHRPALAWSPQLETWPLRFYTRLRFHLVQNLAREKCYFTTFLFLKASAYGQLKPFADLFGRTSGLILTQPPGLDELANLPLDDLTAYLADLSQHHLPNPTDNAAKLHQAIHDSFVLPPSLTLPVQRILELTLAHIRFLQGQIGQVEQWITEELVYHPDVNCLTSVSGLGLVFASGLAAEICPTNRFLLGRKWDKRQHRYRPRNLRDAEDAIAKLAGLWWPRADSGDFQAQDRHLAKSGNRYLRYYLVEAANSLRQSVPEFADFYARKYQQSTKHKHNRALVLTARKSIGLILGLLHRREPYRSKEGLSA